VAPRRSCVVEDCQQQAVLNPKAHLFVLEGGLQARELPSAGSVEASRAGPWDPNEGLSGFRRCGSKRAGRPADTRHRPAPQTKLSSVLAHSGMFTSVPERHALLRTRIMKFALSLLILCHCNGESVAINAALLLGSTRPPALRPEDQPLVHQKEPRAVRQQRAGLATAERSHCRSDSAHRCKASRRGCILSALKGRLAQARLDYGMLLTQPPRR